jgi:outer membrane protein assembly factor BamC
MICSIQKSLVTKIINISLVILLEACANDQHYKYQVNGNETYLKAPALHALNSPDGMILPLVNSNYDIPLAIHNGVVGKKLDIQPPVQPLTLLKKFRSQYTTDTAVPTEKQHPESRFLIEGDTDGQKQKNSIISRQNMQ